MASRKYVVIASGANSVQAALSELKTARATPIEAISALMEGRGISLRAAKAALNFSVAWSFDVSAANGLQQELEMAFGMEAKKSEASSDFYCDEAISGAAVIDVVRETAEVLAFKHTRPFWPVHIVVVPKCHVPSLTDLGDASIETLHLVMEVVRELAREVTDQYGSCRVLTNLGEYQDSKHLHFHVAYGEDYGERHLKTTRRTRYT